MSEQFKSNIERQNKRVTVEMGRTAVLFDYTNTVLYEHPEQYRSFDNVTHCVEADGKQVMTAYFREDNPELYDTLAKEGFPRLYAPYPSIEDESCWLKSQDMMLASDIAEFEERGELY